MTTFAEFKVRLAQGHLKNTHAVDKVNIDDIIAEQSPTILNLTNQGLKDLSSKMVLDKRQIDLEFQTGVNTYYLESSAAYLSDTETEEFVDEDYIKIISVTDSDGEDHNIDTHGHIITPSHRTIRFTNDIMTDLGSKVRITYQAALQDITQDSDEIPLTPDMVLSLQLYVASLFLSHTNSDSNMAKGDKYFGLYLRSIGQSIDDNSANTSEVEIDERFSDRGFV